MFQTKARGKISMSFGEGLDFKLLWLTCFFPSIILVERKYSHCKKGVDDGFIKYLVMWEFWGESHLIRRPILLGKELDTGFLSV